MSIVKKYLVPFVIFFGLLVIYSHNLIRSTYGGDVGDLLNSALTFGVAHAPGYPLFTFLGFLLSRINFISPAFMVGLISVFSGALGALFFYFLSIKFTNSKLISFISTLILAFSYYFWFYSEIAEVFALNNLFAIILIYLSYSFYKTSKTKYFYLLCFFAGLSLTNHQTIVLIFPSLLIITFPNLRKIFKTKKKIITGSILALTGLLPYIYIPIASHLNPPVNWDHVHDLDSFLHLILRKDYGTFSIGSFANSSMEQRLVEIKIYFFDIFTQATLPVSFLSILGAIYLFIKNKRLFFSLILGFLLSGPLFITYAGFPFVNSFNLGVYERFILLSFVIFLMFLPFGLLLIKEIADRFFSQKAFSTVIILVFLIIPVLLSKYNYFKTDLSSLTAGNDVAYDLLSPLPRNSVIFLDGDTVLFNTWYVHYGLKFRQDVNVVNINGVTENKFFKTMQQNYLKKFPKEKLDRDLNTKITIEIAKTRPVFSISNIQPKKGEKLIWAPYGLSDRLFTADSLPTKSEYKNQIDKIWENLHIPSTDNPALGNFTISDIPLFYSSALVKTGSFFLDNYNDSEDALTYLQKAVSVDNNNPKAFQLIGNYYLKKKQCNLADINLSIAIDIDRFNPIPYFFQYYNYVECSKDKNKEKQLIDTYNKTFKSDFRKDLGKTLENISK